MVLIGDTSHEQDHTITLLKSARLLEEAWTHLGEKVKLGVPAIVNAIDQINDRAEDQILSAFPAQTTKSASFQEIYAKGCFPYHELGSLSLSRPGIVYKSVWVPPDATAISEKKREEILDALVCFYDMEDCKPANNGELMAAWITARRTQTKMRHIYLGPGIRDPRTAAAL